jgi:hypothetical protein
MSGRRLVLLCALALGLGAALAAVLTTPARAGDIAWFVVDFQGSGAGTVDGPAGTCSWNGSVKSGDCSSREPVGEQPDLVFIATPASGSVVSEILGCTAGRVGNECHVDLAQVESGQTVRIIVVFSAPGSLLLLTVTTTPGGTVTGPGINCGGGATDCSQSFALDTKVTLTATAMLGYAFVRWTGACASATTNVCTLTIKGATSAGAQFAQAVVFPLTVAPPVGGEVTSPVGIHCGGGFSDCSKNVPKNTQVTLTATPMAGYAFARWEGECATVEIAVCVVVVDAATTVAVVFVKVTPKCKCFRLDVDAPKSEFGSAEARSDGRVLTRFFLSLKWTLLCTAGTGKKCKGTLSFPTPDGFKNIKMWRLKKVGKRTERTPVESPVTCQRTCRLNQSTRTTGTIRVNMDSKKTFDELEGGSFEFKVTAKCSGVETTYVFVVSMGKDGRIKSVKKLIEA